jgi:hypothetical protein
MNDKPHDRTDRPVRIDQPAATTSDEALRRIGDALRGLRYGSVLTIVQDGVVVQIERTEKTRFGR